MVMHHSFATTAPPGPGIANRVAHGAVDHWTSGDVIPVVTVPFLTDLLLGLLFNDMVRVVDFQEFWVGILADPKDFPLGITSLVAAVIW